MVNAAVGGVLIGCAAIWLMLSNGRIAGISGIVASALSRAQGVAWAILFLLGLGLGGYAATWLVEVPAVRSTDAVSWQLIVGGLLVGFGTRLSAGCTSGHGVCGIARLSPRSLVATVLFVLTGAAVATLMYA